MSLIEELEEQRKNIKTDNYSMSIGEIINLYREKDIKLDPAFQRLFRWSDEKKTKFVESVLLGIPIPEIFVAQKEDAKWTVVDGVQRISTILQLVGILDGWEPLTMTYAKYLPSLEGLSWENMPEEAKRIFKRGKFGINIILTENSIQAQYELFQRLNTGGLQLEDQEIRNCLIIMLDESFYERINNLKDYEAFRNCLQLSDRKYQEEFHMEMILRYFIAIYNDIPDADYPSSIHMKDFLDKETIKLIQDSEFNLDEAIDNFRTVFDWLNRQMGPNTFKRYNSEKQSFEGQFSAALFEAIATGVAANFQIVSGLSDSDFQQKAIELQSHETYVENTVHGTRSFPRFRNLTTFSKQFFAE